MSAAPSLDLTVNLGNLLTIAAAGVGALIAFFRVRGKLDLIEASNQAQLKVIEGVQVELNAMRRIAETQARFDERLISLQREVTDLRHNKGFIRE
jgi:hypothetical protein